MAAIDRAAHNKWIVQYFDLNYPALRWMWTNNKSLALHFGYWDESTHTDYEAQLNTNRQLAQRAGLQSGQHILDAGCGIGGSAVWLAETYDVQVLGITLSQEQVRHATENAKKRGVSALARFDQQDFTDIKAEDASFDIVWALESASCALDKREFLSEVFRVLRPGGRLVLSDGFRRARAYVQDEEDLLKRFLFGWAIPDLVTPDEFTAAMKVAGFENIQFENVTEHAEPSMRRLYKISLWSAPIARFLGKLKLMSPITVQCAEASYDQYQAFRRGLCLYGFVSASKPVDR